MNPSYRPHIFERLGFLPKSFSRTKPGSIWLHAVSVGEVASAVPLLQELRLAFPNVPLYLSVSTVAGRQTALRQAAALVDGVFYSPVDYASFVRRTIRTLSPKLLIVLETEIWPNLYFETVRAGARLAVVNGRISNRTWPQYLALRWFFCPVLQLADLVLAQSVADRQRYRKLGVPEDRVAVCGNLKYDAACSAIPVSLSTFGATKVWIAASTVGPNERGSSKRHYIDEDEIVLDAFSALSLEFPQLLLILAPRQPDRVSAVLSEIHSRGLSCSLRSSKDRTLTLPGVLLLDTMGELAGLYPLADVVFVGGSIAPRGGHNIMEPAAAGAPIVTGMHMNNFESIAADFAAANAFVQVSGAADLLPAVRRLFMEPEAAWAMGARARQLVESKRGVTKAVVQRMLPLYYSAYLRDARNFLSRALLTPLATLWKWGGRIKRDASEHRAASLLPIPVPIISVGGITVGGSGKTPFTNYLAGLLHSHGRCPAILTRGYRRLYPADYLIFAPGARVSPFFTGDEAQIFLRAAHAPVGIGAKRYGAAQILLRQFPETDVMLLDDGFQHARMPRDLDIVLIDGLDPFGRDELVPLGRLREPLDALQRADVLVVTRAGNDQHFQAVSSRLRDYNTRAPVFRTALVVKDWLDYGTGEVLPSLAGKKVGAFCGLGNPQNFWDTLESLGLEVVFRWSFEDHHAYKPVELSRIAIQARIQGAQLLVTTEKDRINCPAGLEKLISPLSLAWLEIELRVIEEEPFLDCVLTTVVK